MHTIYYLVYMIFQAINTYSIYRLLRIFYVQKKVSTKIEVVLYSAYYLIITTLYIFVSIPLLMLFANIILLFLITLMYQSTIKKKILSVLLIYIIYIVVETLIITLAGYKQFELINNNTYSREYISLLDQLFICVFLYTIMLLLSNYKQLKNGIELSFIQWFAILIIPVTTLYMLLMVLGNNFIKSDQLTVYLIATFLINFSVFYLYDTISTQNKDNFEKILLQRQNKSYQKQSEIMQASVKSMTSIKHDLNNHLLSIQTLSNTGTPQEVQAYLSGLLEADLSTKQYTLTNNTIIDGIINFKLEETLQYNIEFNRKIRIPQDLKIDAIDITVLLGNLLDNALEATKAILTGKRWINFFMKYDRGRLMIVCQNPYAISPSFDGANFRTRKNSSNNHGIGLKNIKNTVTKYSGELYTSYGDSIFEVKIIIFINMLS